MAQREIREQFGFSVDTHLFRELGELLVGRDSTALIELIKNAYDADASLVVVRGKRLRYDDGHIVVSDNGVGMTPEVFRGAFLRIAGRYKERGSRRSPKYGRQYTGAKGVGRLSAHKLARRLTIKSIPAQALTVRRGVQALIDWERVENDYETIDDAKNGLDVFTFDVRHDQSHGTELRLEKLRRRWTSQALSTFVTQVASCRPPNELLIDPPGKLFAPEAFLGELTVSSQTDGDPGFRIKFEGDLNAGDDLWPLLLEQADWLLEISARPDGVRFNIQPSIAQQTSDHELRSYKLRREHPDPKNGPFFSARIYARVGRIGGIGERTAALQKFARASRGVRVYVEGFRVLPYGDGGDDWLYLDRDYSRRERSFEDPKLDAASSRLLEPVGTETFLMQGNDQYAGAVFMTGDDAASLRPVVNREGFVQDAAFETLRELVRNGIDLLTRVRAAHRNAAKQQRQSALKEDLQRAVSSSGTQTPTADPGERPSSTAPPSGDVSVNEDIKMSISVTRRQLKSLQSEFGSESEASVRLEIIERAIDYIEEAQKGDEGRATLQILAGVGLQLAAFVHDINGILGLAQSVRTLAVAARREDDATRRRSLLKDAEAAADELVQSLARQSSYLVEVVGPDARRRRRRLPYGQAIEPSLRLLTTSIRDRQIEVLQQLEGSARTPPIFPAEITIIMTNVLTNAIKAAGDKGRILIRAEPSSDGGLILRVENTGVKVDLANAERWFRPFESTTTDVDTVLGQGMGMGLPIVRRLLTEYNGSVRFVEPSPEYQTAIEIRVPGRRIGE
ncbi:Histidine kinase-, DNA gyrase B-, and HSP90-like ATPase [Micromonospora purpureochromogenes]|uniref:histidine kinase n=1 Tax=Micromonospora purpureochromogenes TaxID=47872 RepID=A0A1C5AJ95_9ACTN|nr:ATP-binding protein [Micromonospora purpureochromogenes]SCF45290.1 Histidine kinase-, DNA gyrase B-, and HSP90-like ATPase [Micromonospora purpureochromogenes]